jgi:hypothetical protein
MWHTASGKRVLHGAEARLFAEALLSLLDEALVDQPDDCDLGLSCFDNLTYGQKVFVLAAIGNGLLREEVPILPLTAVLEGGIAAVFQHLRNCVTFEIETNAWTTWRQMIVAARKAVVADAALDAVCADPDEWDLEIQNLSDGILWDVDYESDDLSVDRAPRQARELRRPMGIDNGYFDAVAEDLTDQQAEERVAELRKVCAELVGQ